MDINSNIQENVLDSKWEEILQYELEQIIWDKIVKSIDKDGNAIMENFIYDSENNEYVIVI